MDDGDKIKANDAAAQDIRAEGISSQDIKTRLLAERQEIELSHTSGGPVALDQTRQGRLSRMDALQQQAMAQATEKRRAIRLQQILAALDRLENNSYGYCAICDEEIEIRRLSVDPATPFCRAHAR